MRKFFFFLFILTFSSQNVSAQVRGIVVDSATKAPMDKAVVGMVIKLNPNDTSFTVTNEKGAFVFETVPSTNFSIVITSVSYRPVAKFITVTAVQKTIDLGEITLANMAKVLEEVVIETAPVTIKEDTIEYRADAFKVKENAVVEDLLKKLPGVQVDKDGNIKAQGKEVTKVKVNGKEFFGGDPKTATKELPANIVDKVQVIDDYGDQATVSGIKDGNPDKVMNIQLKKDKNTGAFGRLTAGVGDKGRYLASFNGNYFKNNQQISLFANSNNTSQSLFNFGGANRGMGNMISSARGAVNDMGGAGSLMNAMSNGDLQFLQSGLGSQDGITNSNSIGLNYRDEWSKRVSVYGSYTFSKRKSTGYKIVSQQNLFQNKTFINNQNSEFENSGENHRFFFNIEYNIDSFNYIKITPNITYSVNNGVNNSTFNYFADSSTKTIEGYNNNLTGSSTPNLSANILYNHKFKKRGRNFSASLNSGLSEAESDQDVRNNTIQYVAPAGSFKRFSYISQNNTTFNYSVRFTYSEPLSKTRALDIAYSHNLSYSRNNKQTFDVNSAGAKTLNDQLSNDYENNFNTDRANITVRTTEKKYNYTLGLSVQPVNLRGFSKTKDSAYNPINRVNIFPVARFAMNFSKTKSLTFNYRGDAQQPGFAQLQDVIDVSNPQYLTKGNPNLRPSIHHSLNLFYNNFNFVSGRVLFTSLSYSTIQNQIVNSTTLIGNSGVQLSVPQNVNGYYNVNGFYNYSRPYKNRKYVISLNGNLNYNHNVNLIDSVKNFGYNWIANQGINLEINHKDWLEFGVGANYTINSVKYSNAGSSAKSLQNQDYSSWAISSNVNLTFPQNWVLKYDFDFTINHGLTGEVSKNIALMNASLEKQLFKKKNGIIRLQAFDLFDQNSAVNRTVTANAVIDSRTNRLTRYFMLSFTYRLQKFAGKQPQPKNMGNLMKIVPVL